MRLDIVLPNEGHYMVEAMNSGPHWEAMGWEGIWLSDHLLGIAEDHLHKQNWLDILISMAHLAAQTKRVRLGSGVVVLPYRDPVLLARMVASLDHLSGGRIDFGVGTGWLRREYKALGVGDIYDERGPYSTEMLDVMLACWKGGEVEFHGKYFDFDPVVFDPGPLQGDRVPLWIGTLETKGAPIRRVAKYADYWHPSASNTTGGTLTPEEFRRTGEALDEMAGRKIPRSIRIRCENEPEELIDLLHQFAEAGCVQAACSFFKNSPDFGTFDKKATRFWKGAGALLKV